jgi:hypothetical protein
MTNHPTDRTAETGSPPAARAAAYRGAAGGSHEHREAERS